MKDPAVPTFKVLKGGKSKKAKAKSRSMKKIREEVVRGGAPPIPPGFAWVVPLRIPSYGPYGPGSPDDPMELK